MDGFGGTKCGTGLQKKWWGDKEPSDKSSIWYKGGCPFVYDASTKSWVLQSTSGGGGSLTGLALLKSFIDSHNYNGYDYTGVTIGVKSNAKTYEIDRNVFMKDDFATDSISSLKFIAFDLTTDLFVNCYTSSGTGIDTHEFIFFVVGYASYNKSTVVRMPNPSENSYITDVQTLINAAYDGTAVNYDDLK